MSRMCGTCKGTGLLTSLDQLQRSTAPKTVPCHTCRGRGFVEDVIDLAAENERLKAKLDAVRAECKQSLQSSRGLSAKLSVLRLLAILDGGGDDA